MDETMDSMVFYRSFFDAIEEFGDTPEEKYAAMKMILEYGLDNIEPDADANKMVRLMFTLIKKQIDANKDRRKNGKNGGRKVRESQENETEKPMVSNSETNGLAKNENEKPMVSEVKTNGYEKSKNKKPNVYVNEYVYGNVNGYVNDNVIDFDFINDDTRAREMSDAELTDALLATRAKREKAIKDKQTG